MNKLNVLLRIKVLIFFILGYCISIKAQIDMSDTTALVIAHWKMNESQSYKVAIKTNTTEEDNLISSEEVNYDLAIRVADSTQVGYILECTRLNYVVKVENKVDSACLVITQDIPFLILTDEYGSSIQALNWEDVSNEIEKRAENLIESNIDHPNRLQKLNRIVRQAKSKATIEANLIPDIQQLFAYHGAKYKFDERVDFKVKVPNNFGGDPLDANSTMIMDQINLGQGTFIIRSSQRINPNQLTAVTYDYLSSLNMIGAELPPYEEFPLVTKLIWGGVEIHGQSGWIIFSEETKQTNNGKLVSIEERTLELVRDNKR